MSFPHRPDEGRRGTAVANSSVAPVPDADQQDTSQFASEDIVDEEEETLGDALLYGETGANNLVRQWPGSGRYAPFRPITLDFNIYDFKVLDKLTLALTLSDKARPIRRVLYADEYRMIDDLRNVRIHHSEYNLTYRVSCARGVDMHKLNLG